VAGSSAASTQKGSAPDDFEPTYYELDAIPQLMDDEARRLEKAEANIREVQQRCVIQFKTRRFAPNE
jgi:hypothetical protein